MIDFIFGLLNDAAVEAAAAINWLLGAVVTLASGEIVLAKAIFTEDSIQLTKWAQLLKFLQFGWLLGTGGLLAKLFAAIQKLHDWLQKHIQPIIDFLKKWKAWFDHYYQTYVLPIINMIQRIRRFLLILRLLHIHVADALDKWLQKYEAALNNVFLTIHGTLNQLIGWASLASDPISLGRMVLVSVTGRRMAGAVTRVITGLPIGHFFPSTSSKAFAFEKQPMSAKDYVSEATNPPASQILAPLLSFMGGGEYDDQVGATDSDIDAAEPTPWGPDYITSLLNSAAVIDGLGYDGLSLRQALEAKAGNVYNAGVGGAAAAIAQLAPEV